ncbi:MAG: tRNA lysidine(34) synthetase TilS [Rhizobiales bacterium]|nr:tRNA lysidine(34) synthetase TilS [Hyphomicrobiales bacterium]
MPAADAAPPIAAAEAAALFAELQDLPGLLIAVSGGPDSTALLMLLARWRGTLRRGPDLHAATVDHGLRPEARSEARAVAATAAGLGVPHHTLAWRGEKPRTGLQEAAREARYRLLARAARRSGVAHVVTAHTRDDQAETVLFRLARGTGIGGLGGMAFMAPLPGDAELCVVRPLLDIPKARLVATLDAARIGYAQDPSNRDPRYTRVRLRATLPLLAAEGLDPVGLARIAARARRADVALEWAAAEAMRQSPAAACGGKTVASVLEFQSWPTEIALRVLRRHIEAEGSEGPVELGKLEALLAALTMAAAARQRRWRRTLAGACVTLADGHIVVETAPARRSAGGPVPRPRAAASAAKASSVRRRTIKK